MFLPFKNLSASPPDPSVSHTLPRRSALAEFYSQNDGGPSKSSIQQGAYDNIFQRIISTPSPRGKGRNLIEGIKETGIQPCQWYGSDRPCWHANAACIVLLLRWGTACWGLDFQSTVEEAQHTLLLHNRIGVIQSRKETQLPPGSRCQTLILSWNTSPSGLLAV